MAHNSSILFKKMSHWMFILREMVFFFFWRISKELMILMYDFCHFPRIVISRIVACFEQFWGRFLTIRVVDSGWKGPYSRHGLVIVLCCRARRFTLILSLSTQEYFWVLANCQGNLTKQWWGGVGWGLTYNGQAYYLGGREDCNTPGLLLQ